MLASHPCNLHVIHTVQTAWGMAGKGFLRNRPTSLLTLPPTNHNHCIHPFRLAWPRQPSYCSFTPPPHLQGRRPVYVAADLSKVDLATALKGTGFDPSQPTLFTVEGERLWADVMVLCLSAAPQGWRSNCFCNIYGRTFVFAFAACPSTSLSTCACTPHRLLLSQT